MSRRLVAPLLAFLVTTSCLADSLAPHMRAVEGIRGRKFTADVKNTTIDRDELPARLKAQMEKDLPYTTDQWVSILQALQLIDTGTKDVLPKLLDLYQGQVLAFYDPGSRTYYSIRQLPKMSTDVPVDPKLLEETVVVHELMHALQDQHFNIGKATDALRKDTDAGMAYHALLEGEASLVMLAHMMNKMGVALDDVVKNDAMIGAMAAAAAQQGAIDDSAPKYFTESMMFPYLKGLEFVIAAYRRGGWKELDRVYANPPRTTREILHPDEYFNKTFKPQPFDGKATVPNLLAVEHLGEFHWGYLVGADNARGWVNDRVVLAKTDKGEISVAAETKWESPERAKAFAAAYGAFLRKRNLEAKIAQDGDVVRADYLQK